MLYDPPPHTHLVDEEIKMQGDLGNGKVTKVAEKFKAENNPHPPPPTNESARENLRGLGMIPSMA